MDSSRRCVLTTRLPKSSPRDFRGGSDETCLVECNPYLGVQVAALPRLQDCLQATDTPSIRFLCCLVNVEERTAEGSDRMDAATMLSREEQAAAARTLRGDQSGDAKCTALLCDYGTG